jgi:ATP/maltotriose-dependent transcriptional regulator MalT
MAYVLGKPEISRRYFSEALEVSRAGNTPWYRKGSIDVYGAACHLIIEGQIEQAVELLALLRRWDAMPSTRDKWSRWLETLQAELAPEVFAAAVRRGEANDLETVAAALANRFSAPNEQGKVAAPADRIAAPSLDQPLTSRELEILRLIADGLTNAEIADQLFLTKGTVKWYVHQLLSKLYAATRTQAVARARTLGLLT